MRLFTRDKSFYKKVLLIAGPISAQQIITVGVNMMDTIMLGQLDEVAISASSTAVQVHTLFHFMSMGIGMGASVLIARYWGAQEHLSLRKTLVLMYRFCLLLAGLFTLATAVAPAQILSLLSPDEAVIAEGVRYLRWALPCFFLFGMSNVTTLVLRNLKQMHIPLLTAIGAFFINIFFNWVFIFGKLGAPAMGVAGAALGTLISRAFEFAVNCGYFFLWDKTVRFRVKDLLLPCGDLLPEYIRISVPVLISDTLLGLGSTMSVSIAGHIGTVYMSANTITQVTQQIATVFTAGLGQSAVIITGNTLGAGEREKAQEQGVTFVVLAFLLGGIFGLIIAALGPAVVGYYRITEETRAVALELMNSVGLVTVFMAVASVLTKGVLRGGGDTKFLMFGDVFFLWAVSVPLGAAAGLLWHWPPFWIFFCLRIDHLIKTVLCIFRLLSGRWIKTIQSV